MPRPRPVSFAELLEDVQVISLVGDPSVRVHRLTYDSRAAGPDTVFFAYQGVNQDVHRFIPDAVARGASAVVGERPATALQSEYAVPPHVPVAQVADARHARALAAARLFGYPSRKLPVIGVTGTDGKTTTCTLIHSILQAQGRRPGLVTTVSARIGDKELDTGLHVTTPEPEDVQAYLAAMVAEGCDAAVLEVTSHGLAQHRVTGVHFDLAVITNLTREALDYHPTFDAYAEAKARLFHMVSESHRNGRRTAVLNKDDVSFDRFRNIPMDQTLTYSLVQDADFVARDLSHGSSGLTFSAETPDGTVTIRSPLLGAYNASNILAAMAATGALGCSPEAWRSGVAGVSGVPGRMEVVDAGQEFLAIVDFAHTPNALEHALRTARSLTSDGGRVITVFGCAGLRDPGKRGLMGQVAGNAADLTVVTAEDPRTESVEVISSAIAAGLEAAGAEAAARAGDRSSPAYLRIPDRGGAIRAAAKAAGPGDVVIVCGKGHEQSMAFGEVEYPWDDREALRAALEDRDYGDLPTG